MDVMTSSRAFPHQPKAAPMMVRFSNASSYLLVFALLVVAYPVSPEHRPLNKELTGTVDAYFGAWINGRIGDMSTRLTLDSEYHPNGGATVAGREALRAYYQDFVDHYDIALQWNYEQAVTEGDWGHVMGVYFIRYAPTDSREEIARGGRFFMHLVRESDGHWRIRRELTQTTTGSSAEF